MQKLNKSQSNPSKFQIYAPSNKVIQIKKKSSNQLTSRSLSGVKKFGIRHVNVSPISNSSRSKPKQQKSSTIISVNTINLNQLMHDKKFKMNSPQTLSTRSKVPKLNYFRSNNVSKILNKMNHHQKTKKNNLNQSVNCFKLHPIKKLANGQYGSIYLAISEETKFLVVLKCFKKDKVAIDFLIDQFKIQMYCKHPNILPSYGFFFGRSQIYLIMEAGSHNLYSLIKKDGFFSQKRTATCIHQIMKGLSYLHLNGIIHRDLKPQNVIVVGGVMKISDFGWSTITSTQRRTYCGTLEYVSPEVSMGKTYDIKIDSWSIGVLAYEMLTGFSPYPINQEEKDRQKNKKLNYSKKLKFPCTISLEGQIFIQKMLSFDPKKRPSVVQALRDQWIQLFSQEIGNSNKATKILDRKERLMMEQFQ